VIHGECLRQEFSEKPWVWHHPARFQLLGDGCKRRFAGPLDLSDYRPRRCIGMAI